MATDWNVWGTIKQAAGVWFRKDGYALKVTPTGTTLTADRTINLPNANADTTLATIDGTQTLTNKDIDGGTASDTSRVTLPQNTTSNLSGLTGKKGTIFYDSTDDKIKYDVGGSGASRIKTVGGGLITVAKQFSDGDFTAEAGKWYQVDMTGVNAQRTITLPAGDAEIVIAISVINNNNTTYLLTVDGNASETIWYNDAANADVDFAYEEMTANFMWDTMNSRWNVAVSQTPVSGTWGGDLIVAGRLFSTMSPTVLTGNTTLDFLNFYSVDSASTITLTLPAATGSNQSIIIESIDTGLAVVDGNGSETINGATTQVIGQFQSITIRDYASGKWIIMH